MGPLSNGNSNGNGNGNAEMHFIDMGRFQDFEQKLQQVQGRFEDREFRFRAIKGTPGDFWVFEEEDEEMISGAILRVQEDRVYAISEDVYNLVSEAFSRSS